MSVQKNFKDRKKNGVEEVNKKTRNMRLKQLKQYVYIGIKNFFVF